MSATAGWTYGLELEWPDVDCTAPLPPGWGWSATDYTIVNSNAVANDPRRQLVHRGGELNTPPYRTPEHATADVAHMWGRMEPGYNYRSNLHVHLHIPGLAEDLPAVQRVASYTRTHLPALLPQVDPLDALLRNQPDPQAAAGAARRLRHSQRSRHYLIPASRAASRAAATTLAGALAAEVPTSRTGRPAWALAPREAVNLRALRKHGTIEFRLFAAPAVAARWGPALPRQAPYEHRLEVGWRHTNLRHNPRAVVQQRLREMGLLA